MARSANEADDDRHAARFSRALKIDSPDISPQKSDVQGVALNLVNATGVRDAYNDMVQTVARLQPKACMNGVTVQNMASAKRGREIYVGLVTDDPLVWLLPSGLGGTMIELIDDRRDGAATAQPVPRTPPDRALPRVRNLGEWRGNAAVNMDALEQVLLRVSEMVRAAPTARNGHQPLHRGRARRRGGGCTHRH